MAGFVWKDLTVNPGRSIFFIIKHHISKFVNFTLKIKSRCRHIIISLNLLKFSVSKSDFR